MKMGGIALITVLCSLCLNNFSIASDAPYEHARDAYNRGDYAVARIYCENLLDDSENRQYFPDALYYLARIHLQKDDFVEFLSSASRFLQSYSYDSRASEIFTLLLKRLLENRAYRVAVQYVEKYEFLLNDVTVMESLGQGLIQQGELAMADYALSFCAPSDKIKIMRARTNEDYHARDEIFRSLQGPNRDLYVMENYLHMGDTVGAYLTFRNVNAKGFADEDLYRYAKITLLFAPENTKQYADRLKRTKGFEHKSRLLDFVAGQRALGDFMPQDREEVELFLQVCTMDTVSKSPPDEVSLDSILRDATDTLAQIGELRRRHRGNYYLDSLYCQEMIKRGDYNEAAKIVSVYVGYRNTRPYVLKTIGYSQYANKDFESAAKNIILSNARSPYPVYILAECLRATGHSIPDLYTRVMAQTTDSTLHDKALRAYLLDRYDAEDYDEIRSVPLTALKNDTALIRVHARSLARCGALALADSIFRAYFTDSDYELFDLYGEYLFSEKQYRNAMAYYDSVIGGESGSPHEGIHYNWALAAFYNNDMDTALYRFRYYTEHFKKGRHFHDAIFKIATINYLHDNYDSAAYYYGLAGEDKDLMVDAYQNQLISYKKAGNWPMVISTGRKMLRVFDKEDSDVRFEIGYASLRAGKVNDAIDNLQIASRLGSDPGYYYWLGEAYLGKGDFTRAFHSYQRIADLFSGDEMWAPTARYKTGIVLELLDEMDAAREVYRKIVKERGVNDPIGAEADARLKLMSK
jgi:TolA-binding protein